MVSRAGWYLVAHDAANSRGSPKAFICNCVLLKFLDCKPQEPTLDNLREGTVLEGCCDRSQNRGRGRSQVSNAREW